MQGRQKWDARRQKWVQGRGMGWRRRNNYELLEQRTGLGPTASTPCRGIKHIAQGIALGRFLCLYFALNGHKPYQYHYAFAPAGRSRLHIIYTQGDALG